MNSRIYQKFFSRLGKTVRRGIRPPTFRTASLRSRIMPTPVPEELVLSLQEYNKLSSGAVESESALKPCVDVGEWVAKYQVVAKGQDAYSVPVHAPTSGTVIAIEPLPPSIAGDPQRIAIRLKADEEERELELEPPADFRSISTEELIERIAMAGICGMGGAGFPTAVKLKTARDKAVSTLIINAVECEPYISCDEALLRERAELAVRGAEVLQAACLASKCYIAIDNSMPASREALIDALRDSEIKLHIVPRRYPAGDERQLIKAITHEEVSAKRLPMDQGVIVQNIATAVAAYEAVATGKPCISRIVTLAGNPLKTPKNFEVLIGTPIRHLLDLCGADPSLHGSTIQGGSMMGKTVLDDGFPIEKTTNCIIATCEEDFPEPNQEQPCIRCGYCEQACPSRLQPQFLVASIRSGEWDRSSALGLSDCIECGACAYVCPSSIPLVHYFRAAKEDIQLAYTEQKRSEMWQDRFQYHQYRIKRNQERAQERKTKSKSSSKSKVFSRSDARQEISAAVERVKRRRLKHAEQED